jgi:diguanylate cyclase (GGDEF)-like protein
MELVRRRYYRYLTIFMILLCALCIGLVFWAVRSSRSIDASQIYRQIYSIKKVFLKDTVQNMLRDIDRLRELNRNHAGLIVQDLSADFNKLYSITSANFKEVSIDFLSRNEYREILNIHYEDNSENKVLYHSGQNIFSRQIKNGNYSLKLGVNEEWVNRKTKSAAAEMIHALTFENDGYIWVNEIINWEGGDNYAIRRIHPNLIKTEGSYLSTKMKDIKGNTPYLTELEGVRRHGELYSTYFFKRKDSDTISEKLTYAALYKDYNWIVAMGIYLEDVQVYIDSAEQSGKTLTMQIVAIVIGLMIILFIAGAFVLTWMEKRYILRTTNTYREESNIDPLTGALNRRMCDIYLNESFKRYRRGLDHPFFFFFDIDDFKKVNDTYGHNAGDRVLTGIANKVVINIRSTDHLFRWGGEEFLLMCYGVNPDGAYDLAVKLNRVIEETPVEIPDNTQGTVDDGGRVHQTSVTISIGISCFHPEDLATDPLLKRLDTALYRAKREGKNCTRME